MRLYSEIELNEQLDRCNLSPKQKGNIRGLISIITEKYSDQIEKMKCCANCKNCEINFTNDSGIKYGCKKLGRKCDDCILNDYYHWELKNE